MITRVLLQARPAVLLLTRSARQLDRQQRGDIPPSQSRHHVQGSGQAALGVSSRHRVAVAETTFALEGRAALAPQPAAAKRFAYVSYPYGLCRGQPDGLATHEHYHGCG